jgi:hypothetical protein
MVAFAQANRMKVRGHTRLVSAEPHGSRHDLGSETLKVVLKEHIDSVVGHYKGKVAWDVVNEAFNDGTGSLRVTGSPWATTSAQAISISAFRNARRGPAALLFYNDYNLETPGLKQDSVFARISGMKARGIRSTASGSRRTARSTPTRPVFRRDARRDVQPLRRARAQDSHQGARHPRSHAGRDVHRARSAEPRLHQHHRRMSRRAGVRSVRRVGAERRRVVGTRHVPRVRTGAAVRRFVFAKGDVQRGESGASGAIDRVRG